MVLVKYNSCTSIMYSSDKEKGASRKEIMVKKRSGRLEPFDGRKMARATSRAGVPYSIALGIAKTIRNHESLADREKNNPVSSVTLRKMVAEELVKRGHETVAKSYLGYKKIKGAEKERYARSLRHKSKVSSKKSINTRAKQAVKDKDNTGGRPPRW